MYSAPFSTCEYTTYPITAWYSRERSSFSNSASLSRVIGAEVSFPGGLSCPADFLSAMERLLSKLRAVITPLFRRLDAARGPDDLRFRLCDAALAEARERGRC